jgi:hypothetical protein
MKRFIVVDLAPNGLRYPSRSTLMRAGGWDKSCRRNGKALKPRKSSGNALCTHLPTVRLIGRFEACD